MKLTLEKAAFELGISVLEMRRLTLGTDTIPYERIGPRKVLINPDDIKRYAASLESPAPLFSDATL